MPEGDTVHRQAARLDRALAGGTVALGELRVPSLATRDLVDWQVLGCAARGKHLVLHLRDSGGQTWTLHTHLMMDGIWQVDELAAGSNQRWRSWSREQHRARVLLEVEHADGRRARAIGFEVQQIALVPTDQEHELVDHLGPDLLDEDWGPDHVDRVVANLVAESRRPIGLALLDQRIVAGIGNVYRSEICFLRRIHPATPVAEVADLAGMVELSRRLLWVNRDRTNRITTGSVTGRDGGLWVYGRRGKGCRRCGTPVRDGRIEEPALPQHEPRIIYTCPTCQPLHRD